MLDIVPGLWYYNTRKREKQINKKKKEVKKMKKIVRYVLVNNKNNVMDSFDTEAEAKAAVEKAAKRGWARFIEKVEHEINENPEVWELDGAMADPESINWEREEW